MEKIESIAEHRVGAASAMAGSLLLLAGTVAHPMGADPNDPVAAFTEYGTNRLWIASHLTQLVGMALAMTGLLFLTQKLQSRNSATLARLAGSGVIASFALVATLQAVDGIALKTMVDTWIEAPSADKKAAFYAALAVRHIEIGLASMLSISFGITVMLYGIALWIDEAYPRWISYLAIAGGAPAAVAGIVMAYTGFSSIAMALNMPAGSILLVWLFMLGLLMWRRNKMQHDAAASFNEE